MLSSKQLSVAPLGIIFLLISCLSPSAGPDAIAPLASLEQNSFALTFPTITDKPVVYLFRPHSMPHLRALILVDNREIGFTVSNTYLRIEMSPGEHEFVSRLEYGGNRSKAFQSKPNSEFKFTLQAEAGRIYFIQQSPYPLSWNGRLDLHLVSEKEGKHEITRGRYRLLDTQAGQTHD